MSNIRPRVKLRKACVSDFTPIIADASAGELHVLQGEGPSHAARAGFTNKCCLNPRLAGGGVKRRHFFRRAISQKRRAAGAPNFGHLLRIDCGLRFKSFKKIGPEIFEILKFEWRHDFSLFDQKGHMFEKSCKITSLT